MIVEGSGIVCRLNSTLLIAALKPWSKRFSRVVRFSVFVDVTGMKPLNTPEENVPVTGGAAFAV